MVQLIIRHNIITGQTLKSYQQIYQYVAMERLFLTLQTPHQQCFAAQAKICWSQLKDSWTDCVNSQ